MASINVGPRTLVDELVNSARKFVLVQKVVDLLTQQQQFEQLSGSGFTYLMGRFQAEMRQEAAQFLADDGAAYFALLASLQTLVDLRQAILAEDGLLGRVPSDGEAKRQFAEMWGAVTQQSEAFGGQLDSFRDNLQTLHGHFQEKYSYFHEALEAESTDLPAEIAAKQHVIQTLNEQVHQDIVQIVEGADKLSTGGSDLVTGLLTVVELEDVVDADGMDETVEKMLEKGPDEASSFSIGAFEPLEEGAADLTAAQADLKQSNQALVTAYRALARLHIAIAIAKAIEVQAGQFTRALAAFEQACDGLSQLWTSSDGSGVGDSLAQFGRAVASADGGEPTARLIEQLQQTQDGWSEVALSLQTIRRDLTQGG